MTPNSELYSQGFRTLRGSWLHALAVTLLVGVLQGIAGSMYIGIVILGALTIGQYLYFLQLWRTGSHPQLEVIFDGFKPGDRFVQSLIAMILISVAVFFGMLLLVIPGIIAAIGLSMTFFIMAEDPGIRATDAMRQSWAMVWDAGNFWKVLGFQLLAIPLFLLGTLLLVVGIFLVLPVYQTALAGLYDSLKGGQSWTADEPEFLP
jgi:uncharacterized membrane protein